VPNNARLPAPNADNHILFAVNLIFSPELAGLLRPRTKTVSS
jgi:hypothetical protein